MEDRVNEEKPATEERRQFHDWQTELAPDFEYNPRTYRNYRTRLNVGTVSDRPGGGLAYYLTRDEFFQIYGAMRRNAKS